MKKLTQEEVQKRAHEIWGSHIHVSEYKDMHKPMTIKCDKHGVFTAVPGDFLRTRRPVGCSVCILEKKQEEYYCKVNDKHNNIYKYVEPHFVSQHCHIGIICSIHGSFNMKAQNHLLGQGCRECGIIRRVEKQKHPQSRVIEDMKAKDETFNRDLDYSKYIYKGDKQKGEVTCNICNHIWLQRANDNKSGKGCPNCFSKSKQSDYEVELINILKTWKFNPIEKDRQIIKPRELDIVIPEKKIAIEVNGLYWHSDKVGTDKYYHYDKFIAAEKAGYRLIQIWEDLWLNKKEIVLNCLASVFGIEQHRLQARKLNSIKLNNKEANEFLIKHHLQGTNIGYNFAIGLVAGNELVSVMTIGKSRFKKNNIEIHRYASSFPVTGGFEKMLSFYIKQNPEVTKLTSFSDLCWFTGEVYKKAGFILTHTSEPDYYWCKNNKHREHRLNYQKHKLKEQYPDLTGTEEEICHSLGMFKVYDCGNRHWELTIK